MCYSIGCKKVGQRDLLVTAAPEVIDVAKEKIIKQIANYKNYKADC